MAPGTKIKVITENNEGKRQGASATAEARRRRAHGIRVEQGRARSSQRSVRWSREPSRAGRAEPGRRRRLAGRWSGHGAGGVLSTGRVVFQALMTICEDLGVGGAHVGAENPAALPVGRPGRPSAELAPNPSSVSSAAATPPLSAPRV